MTLKEVEKTAGLEDQVLMFYVYLCMIFCLFFRRMVGEDFLQ